MVFSEFLKILLAAMAMGELMDMAEKGSNFKLSIRSLF